MSFWLADVIPSLPAPSSLVTQVDMSGFVFTMGGLTHNMTTSMQQDLLAQVYAPPEAFASILASVAPLQSPESPVAGTS